MTVLNALPEIKAPTDKHILAIMFRTARWRRSLSSKLQVSSANDDMVVSELQKPIAANSVWFASKFKRGETTENTPKMKLPRRLTRRTLTESPYTTIGELAIL